MSQPKTLNDALDAILPKHGTTLGDNNRTFGERGNYVRVSLFAAGERNRYDTLELIHFVNGQAGDRWQIRITHHSETLRCECAYVQTQYGEMHWAREKPRSEVTRQVIEILNFCEIKPYV